MTVRFSALRSGRPITPRKILGTRFCQRLGRTQSHSAAGRIRSIEKNPITSSGIETATIRLVAQCLNQMVGEKLYLYFEIR
jgi:hypothetical protein